MPERAHRLGCLLAAAALCAAPLAGAAGTSASASLTGFTWKLIDLNPDDGLDPGVTLTHNAATWSLRSNGPAPSIDWKEGYERTEVINLTGSAHTLMDAGGVYAWAQASNYTSAFHGWSTDNLSFQLTPWTAIEFSGLAEVQSAEAGSTRTNGRVVFEGSLYGPPSVELDGRSYRIGAFSSELNSVSRVGAASLSGVLQSGAEGGYGYFNLMTIAEVNVTPVPEPSTWSMLLAGLGLVGGRARSRQRKR